jgi:glycosyltransferase involved in cell wall biosynthesis
MRPRVAVLFPFLNGGGGAEAVCFWILEALKDDFDLTLVTLTPTDPTEFDRSYGTALRGAGIRIASPVPKHLARLSRFVFFRLGEFAPVRQHLLMRSFKPLHGEFDLCISAYNEMDLGEPGLQYCHDTPRSRIGTRLYRSWSRYSELQMRENVNIMPSKWMGEVFRRAYGDSFRYVVVYPPAREAFETVSWDERVDDFVCVARLSQEKRIEDAISILQAVRSRGHAVRLRVLTAGGKWLYERKIRHRIRRSGGWVSLEEGVDDSTYRRALASHKYGINASVHEGFGIAIAEMVNAGCIPFVRGRGGQSEIFDDGDGLCFHDPAEAVEKISSVLSSPERQKAIRADLRGRRGLFSEHRFQNEIRELVRQRLANCSYARSAVHRSAGDDHSPSKRILHRQSL